MWKNLHPEEPNEFTLERKPMYVMSVEKGPQASVISLYISKIILERCLMYVVNVQKASLGKHAYHTSADSYRREGLNLH